MVDLSKLFQQLRQTGSKVDKCEFLKEEVGFLGYDIASDGIEPTSNKTKP